MIKVDVLRNSRTLPLNAEKVRTIDIHRMAKGYVDHCPQIKGNVIRRLRATRRRCVRFLTGLSRGPRLVRTRVPDPRKGPIAMKHRLRTDTARIGACVIAVLVAVAVPADFAAGAEPPRHPSASSGPATSAPAPTIVAKPPDQWFRDELVQAVVAVNKRQWSRARAILDKLRSPEKNNPLYFLVTGYFYAMSNRDGIATGAYRYALHLEERLADAHLQLALSYLRTRRSRESLASLALGARLAPDDPRFTLAEGLVHCALGNWELGFGRLERASKATGPIGKQARDVLRRLKASAETLQAIAARKAPLQAQLAKLAGQTEVAKRDGKAALDKKEKLRESYDEDRDDAKRDFRIEYRRIEEIYVLELPPESLKSTNLGEYERRVGVARGRRNARIREAKRGYDRSLADIDAKYRDLVSDIDAQISLRKRELKRYSTGKLRLSGQIQRLERTEKQRLRIVLRDIYVDYMEMLSDLPNRLADIRPRSYPPAIRPTTMPATMPG